MIKLQREDIETCFGVSSHTHPDRIRSPKVKLNDYNKALSRRQPSIPTDESMSILIDSTLLAATDGNSFPSIDTKSGQVYCSNLLN